MPLLLGVDTGGTFTDFVLLSTTARGRELRTHKVLSTPEAPERAILQGIAELDLLETARQGGLRLVHGSTVATNAALEDRGARTVFVTNRGFADLLSIGRQTRPRLHALETPPPAPPVPAGLCLECGGRIDANGRELEPLEEQEMEALARRIQALAPRAVAINLLFSFVDEDHEKRLAEFLSARLGPGVYISRSSQVLPEYREYERGIATWLNASLGPLVQDYLLRLQGAVAPSPVAVMQSSGGTVAADQAAERAVHLLLSGPAGGLAAADFLARALGERRLLTFDMGGTSTDVALLDGGIRLSNEGGIGPWPVGVPMVDMHTIGAGGGSIAFVDAGGLLRVGPRSAGAQPGPACYGLGGTLPTVSDANAVLGRLPSQARLAGRFELDFEAARRAVGALAQTLGIGLEEAAAGIIRLADEHMARALRVISVERGYDPADFRLCCFGGAGGLHICALADALGMRRALVPLHAGVLSALGMLLAPVERQLTRTHRRLLAGLDEAGLAAIVAQLRAEGLQQLAREGLSEGEVETEVSVDLRYAGQSYHLNLAWRGRDATGRDFHRLHETRYGHALAAPVELVNVRVALRGAGAAHELARLPEKPPAAALSHVVLHGLPGQIPVYRREALARGQSIDGPALVMDDASTMFLAPRWRADVDAYGNLLLETAP